MLCVACALVLLSALTFTRGGEILGRLRPPVVGAHQGGLFRLRPNSLAQFQEAIDDGVDVIEMDLRATRDSDVVVFHDDTLEFMTMNCRGPVHEHMLEELRKCRLRVSHRHIPSFREVLALVKGRAIINAEFKEMSSIEPALRIVKEFEAHEWVYFQTRSSEETYLRARNLDPRVALQFRARNLERLKWALSLDDPRLIVIELARDMVTPEAVALVHAAGKLVSTDSFEFSLGFEFFGATCANVWRRGADIAISNAPKSCVAQRKSWH